MLGQGSRAASASGNSQVRNETLVPETHPCGSSEQGAGGGTEVGWMLCVVKGGVAAGGVVGGFLDHWF